MVRVFVLLAALVLSLSSSVAHAYDGNIPDGHPQEPIWGPIAGFAIIVGVFALIVILVAAAVHYEHERHERKRRSFRR